jgi:hypothetical protein
MSTAIDVDDKPKLGRPAWRPNLPSLSSLRPQHSRKYAQHSEEWMFACGEAFSKAFIASGENWPK